jgi:hypothetical protein
VILAGAAFGAPYLTAGGSDADQGSSTLSSGSGGQQVTANGVVASWITAENGKPGTTAWQITGAPAAGDIEGYANRVSAVRGETVTLYVSTVAPTYHVEAYRMGWYGGNRGRLVWQSGELPGIQQAPPTITPGTNMVEARWTPSLTFTVTSDWLPGDYLLKLVGSGEQQTHVPLTVRDDSSRAAYVIQSSVTTWEAYNLWGGYDLYQGPTTTGGSSEANRSRVVSFDRPYSLPSDRASTFFVDNELPLVSMVEQLGLDVTYSTDVDLHEAPQRLLSHHALISLAHDEYWSSAMRQGVEAARDHGVNLMFLGANAMYRHIRLEPSSLGPDRHEIDYKSASEDPITTSNPSEATVDWPSPPVPRPESTVIGASYGCEPVSAEMVVTDPSAWVFAGTGLSAGARLPAVVGYEYDRYNPALPGPRNVQLFTHSPVTCDGKPDNSDMTYYTAPSGAGVFDTGTIRWVSLLGGACPAGSPVCPTAVAQRVTQNVLAAFGTGPAGKIHPSQANWAGYYPSGPPVPSPSSRE